MKNRYLRRRLQIWHQPDPAEHSAYSAQATLTLAKPYWQTVILYITIE